MSESHEGRWVFGLFLVVVLAAMAWIGVTLARSSDLSQFFSGP